MLTQNDIESSREVAGAAHTAGNRLRPYDGTVLSVLNRTVLGGLVDNEDSLETILEKRSRHVDGTDVCRHDMELDFAANEASRRVSASLSYAMNTVNPLISEIYTECQKAMKLAVRPSAIAIDICMEPIPALYADGMFENLIDSRGSSNTAGGSPVDDILQDILSDGLTAEQFLATVKTGSPDLDVKIEALLQLDQEQRMPFEKRYDIGSSINVGSPDFPVLLDHRPAINFLFFQGVRNGRLESVDYDVLDGQEKTQLSRALNYYATLTGRQLTQIDRLYKENQLVASRTESKVVVVEETYKNWIAEKGGSPEALIGFLSVNKGYISASVENALKDNPDKYKAEYDRLERSEVTGGRLAAANEVNATIRRGLYAFIREEYREDPTQKSALFKRVDEVIERNRYSQSLPLDLHCLRLTCESLCMDKNNAYEVLTGMRSYLEDNPGSSPSEAATVSAAKLIAKWAVSQVECY